MRKGLAKKAKQKLSPLSKLLSATGGITVSRYTLTVLRPWYRTLDLKTRRLIKLTILIYNEFYIYLHKSASEIFYKQ